ncbi:hypothetical protein KZI27_00680 (plasmid) [Curtobacterium sp. TC1]|nr:hypothetical protein KZI27_00680 [Curtobacterium sp. TC1]
MRTGARWAVKASAMTILTITGLLAAAPAFAAQQATTPTPAAGLGIRLLDFPAEQASDPRAREYIVQTAEPGTTITRRLQITNTTGKTQRVQIAATAASIRHGRFTANGATQNELARWIVPSTAVVTIPNGDHATITTTTKIPTTATAGERYAAIWAQMRSTNASSHGRIAVVNRVGIRAYINVATRNSPPDFTISKLSATRTDDGKPTLTAVVKNTGNTAVDITGQATLTDGPGHTSAGPFMTNAATTLAPAQSSRIRIPTASAITRGPWTATITLRSGNLTRSNTTRITFPAETTRNQDASSPVLIALISGVVLLAVTGGVVVILRRRHTRRHP